MKIFSASLPIEEPSVDNVKTPPKLKSNEEVIIEPPKKGSNPNYFRLNLNTK